VADRADDAAITAAARAAGRGDRAALASFVRATQGDVYRFLLHLAGPRDAEDLAQETYLRALGALPGFAGRSSARTWLLSIARHTAADAVRRAGCRPRTTAVTAWDALPARSAAVRGGADGAVLVRALVAGLDPDRRTAFVLTQLMGLSYADAARVCACPVGTIRSRVARARQDLLTAWDESADRHACGG
jgi:RNA polymerase sigma-70 factor, ECF subfamily